MLGMGIFFAVLNSALHQMVIFWSGTQNNFLKGLITMGIGDITGLYIVFLVIKLITHFIPPRKTEQ